MSIDILLGMIGYRLKRSVHVSWLITAAATGIVGGVSLAAALDARMFSEPAWFLAAIIVAGCILYKPLALLIPCMILAGVTIGIWRGSLERVSLLPYESFYGKTVAVRGSLTEDPERRNAKVIAQLAVNSIDTTKVGGKMWMVIATDETLSRGDEVVAQGVLTAGFGSFSGAIYRADMMNMKQTSKDDLAGQLGNWFASRIRQVVGEPEASLGIGYLIGQRSALPLELDTALVTAGLTHIVVASGYNLTILVRLTRRLFARISKYFSTFMAFAMIAGFVAITGASPSMSRAGLVTSLSLLAWYYGRRFHPLVLLSFAGATTVLISPSYAWGILDGYSRSRRSVG